MARNTLSLRVDGLKSCDAALGALPKATGRNVLVRVLTRAGQPIADTARRLVPKLSHKLEESIAVSTKLARPADKAAFAAVMQAGGSREEAVAALRSARRDAGGAFAEVYIGAGQKPHAHLVEFGWKHHAPQPYLRPAWDSGRGGALTYISTELWGEIAKAAARVAKKAAKGS